MTYEEKLDCILRELAKIKDGSVTCKKLIEETKISQNELNRLLHQLSDLKYITYYIPTEAIISESGRNFIEKKCGFVTELKKKKQDSVLKKVLFFMTLITFIITVINFIKSSHKEELPKSQQKTKDLSDPNTDQSRKKSASSTVN